MPITIKVKRRDHIQRISGMVKNQVKEATRSGGVIIKSYQLKPPGDAQNVIETTKRKTVHKHPGLVSSVDRWDIKLLTVPSYP